MFRSDDRRLRFISLPAVMITCSRADDPAKTFRYGDPSRGLYAQLTSGNWDAIPRLDRETTRVYIIETSKI
jgi:hypothetical protein